MIRRIFQGRHLLFSSLWKLELLVRGVNYHSSLRLFGRPIITRHPGSMIEIEESVTIYSAVSSNPMGLLLPCVIRTLNAGAKISLGKGTGLSGAVICAVRQVVIGENTMIGSGVVIIDNDFHEIEGGRWRNVGIDKGRSVSIGNNVFIGARAIILKGVTIGDGCIVGAGSVVTKDLPNGSTAAGNPARIVKRV